MLPSLPRKDECRVRVLLGGADASGAGLQFSNLNTRHVRRRQSAPARLSTVLEPETESSVSLHLVRSWKQLEDGRRVDEEDNGDSVEVVQHILGVPASNTVIQHTDTLIVFGTSRDIKRFIEINN